MLSWPKFAGRVVMYVSLQAFGEQILLPYNFIGSGAGNQAALTNLANRIANAIRAVNPARNYQIGVGGVLRSPLFGTSTDYAKGTRGYQYVLTLNLPAGGASGYEVTVQDMPAILNETYEGLLQLGYYLAGL